MKKKVLASLLAMALASPGLAMAESVYVKLGVNHTKAEVDSLGDGTATGGTLAVGVQLNDMFDAEVGYLHLGSSDPVFVEYATRTESHIKSQGIYFAGIAKLPVTDAFGIFGKLGAIYAKTEWSGREVSIPSGAEIGDFEGTQKRWAPMIGVGVSYRISEQVTAMLDYTHINKLIDVEGYKAKADLVTASLKYSF